GGATNDRVINEHDALAVEDLAQGIEFQLDTDVAQSLVRLDEGPRDVAALDQALAVGDATGLGETDGRRRPRIRQRDDDIAVSRRLPSELAAHVASGFV